MRRVTRGLLYLGIIGAVLGLSKIHARYIADPAYSFTGSFRFAWAIAYVVLLAVTSYGMGLPDLPRSIRSTLLSSLGASAAAALGMSILQLAIGDALLPRFVVFGSAILLVPWYIFCAALALGGRVQAEGRDGVVLVAERDEADRLEQDLSLSPERPAQLMTVLSVNDARGETDARSRPLVEAVHDSRATLLVLSREAQADEAIVAQAAVLHESGIRVRTLSLFYEQWLGKLPLFELERVSLMFDIGEIHRARYGRTKRLLDLVFGSLGLFIFILTTPIVLIGNLFANRGPLMFRQLRVGRNGERFVILKFRTMRQVAAGEFDGEWTTKDDLRITRFGRILRVSHVDELPQAINILRGNLSLVGPRPEQPHYVDDLTEKIPFYDLRHLVRPGLTGWAQVKYGYAGDETDAVEKLQYEFFYLRHQSLALDARIMGRTVRSVIGREGR